MKFLNLTEALKAMEKVASHINEMQKIYEDYGTVFDQLVADQSGTEKEVREETICCIDSYSIIQLAVGTSSLPGVILGIYLHWACSSLL